MLCKSCCLCDTEWRWDKHNPQGAGVAPSYKDHPYVPGICLVCKRCKGKDHDCFALHCITKALANQPPGFKWEEEWPKSFSTIPMFLLQQGLENHGPRPAMFLYCPQAENGFDILNGYITPTFYLLAYKTERISHLALQRKTLLPVLERKRDELVDGSWTS